jgi:hypothetical protein
MKGNGGLTLYGMATFYASIRFCSNLLSTLEKTPPWSLQFMSKIVLLNGKGVLGSSAKVSPFLNTSRWQLLQLTKGGL